MASRGRPLVAPVENVTPTEPIFTTAVEGFHRTATQKFLKIWPKVQQFINVRLVYIYYNYFQLNILWFSLTSEGYIPVLR